jgi:outer membrane receptor protein involved in Fe transport
MSSQSNLHRSIRLALAASALAAAAPAAYAQAAGGSVTLEEVVITGSRIGRPELESTTPITIVSAAAIEATGSLNAADVLRTLPAIGVSGISSSNSNFNTSGAGVNTINLRGLGDNRTLVLINGRRMVPGIAGDSAADFNMIPTDFIDRIDVITGGASAVYGSEAVSGVVNVVLKEHFNGVRIRGQGGGTSDGGANTRLGSLTFGSDFADGRGTAFFNVSYDKDSGLYSKQRAISTTDTSITKAGIFGAYSSFVPQGNVFLADSNMNVEDGAFFPDANMNYDYYLGSQGFNRNAYRRITVPLNRTIVSSIFKYNLAEKQELYAEFTYGHTHTEADLEPFPLGVGPNGSSDNVYGGVAGIPLTNAYIPSSLQGIIAADQAYIADLQAQIATDTPALACNGATPSADCMYPITAIGMRRRLTDIAIRSSDARRQTTRFVLGAKGDVLSTPWTYDTYFMYGRTTDSQVSTGQVNVPNLIYALDSVQNEDGSITCRDPVAVALGCVPINLFGANSITPAAANYIKALTTRDVSMEQQVMSAVAQGPLFTLPAGPVRAVVGFERRTESSSEVWDALTNAGLNGGNAAPNVFGSYHVNEAFTEVSVPLLADKPMVKELTLEGAFRTSDYSTVGRVNTWNARLNYAPIHDVRLRGAYSSAVRAPNIGELFSAPSQTFPGNQFNDPCDGVTAATSSAVGTACRAIPAVASAIAADGVFQYGFLDYQSITGFNGGNIHLGPETAKTSTYGIVFTPASLPGFSTSIDFFDIKIDGAVGNVDYSTLLTQCLLTSSPTYCGSVYRNASTGFLTRVDLQLINVATLSTSGADLQTRYRFLMPDRVGGSLDVALNWTYTQKFDQVNSPDTPVVHYAGQIGNPKQRGTLQLDYSGHGFTAGWTVRYQSAMKDQIDLTSVTPNQVPFNNVAAYMYHDVQLRYEFGDKVRTSIYGGARNLFDKKPPFLPSGMTSQITGTETAPDLYDAIGRQFYAGFEIKL